MPGLALELKGSSKWWYGRFQVGGKRMVINLRVAVEGRRPAAGQDGDAAFERSRGRALAEYERVRADLKSRYNIEELTQRVIEAKTGARLDTIKLADLPAAWERIPRRRKPSKTRVHTCKSALRRFVVFLNAKYPYVSELYEITQQLTTDFMKAEEERGVSARTWNATLSLLRSVFRHL